jgi:hypothetical protein
MILKNLNLNDMLFGFEIECFSGLRRSTFQHFASFDLSAIDIEQGSDISIDVNKKNIKKMGGDYFFKTYEFRTIKPIKYCQVINQFKSLADFLQGFNTRQNKFRTNETCGLHIHFSFKNQIGSENIYHLVDFLCKRFSSYNYNPKRKQYVNSNNSYGKYQPARVICPIAHHAEIRIFNGTLNFKVFNQNMKSLVLAIDDFLSETQG